MTEIQILQRWQIKMMRVDMEVNKLVATLDINPESSLLQAIWDLQHEYTIEVGLNIPRSCGWLAWYAEENDYGAKGMEAGVIGDMRPIKTLEDLLWVIKLN